MRDINLNPLHLDGEAVEAVTAHYIKLRVSLPVKDDDFACSAAVTWTVLFLFGLQLIVPSNSAIMSLCWFISIVPANCG